MTICVRLSTSQPTRRRTHRDRQLDSHGSPHLPPGSGRLTTTDSIFAGNSNPYICPTDPINTSDPNGQRASSKKKLLVETIRWLATHTVGRCTAFSAGAFDVGFSMSACGYFTGLRPSHSFAIGGGFATPGASGSMGVFVSNARTRTDLGKGFTSLSSGLFALTLVPVGVVDTYAWGHNAGRRIWSNEANRGVSSSGGVSTNAFKTYTWTW